MQEEEYMCDVHEEIACGIWSEETMAARMQALTEEDLMKLIRSYRCTLPCADGKEEW